MEPGYTGDESQERSTIERFFVGLSECIFHSKLGVVDVQLVDYVADMMIRFIRTDDIHRIRRPNGRPATEVLLMFREAEQRIGLARREVHRHIGDFTLFWSGMYPESLRATKAASTSEQFFDYCQQGKRAYAIAAEIDGGETRPSSDVLMSLSDQFEMCAYGLREIRRELEEGDTGGGLLLG
ncbi:hypothetical protein Poly51_08980 [Rubripirellula tenax]|uniref:Uncharacterized protein n=1 Tax=Rubripirellula tenax TaxID=2528015 RepID=A0A5C6FI96_9BACT|nr:hypothetical protein [Rubripirellula tenax]TWU60620.1 hypothetical protein Poly51_08980 [Rubripirellula tenax]